jgi:hypothetical chaperone protein
MAVFLCKIFGYSGDKMLVYAIDFGTTNSLLAAADEESTFAPIPLDPFAQDPTILRSVLYFPTMKQCFYGAQAISEFVQHDMHGRLIRSIKKFLPVRSFVGTWIENRPMNLEDLIGAFLKELRRRANEHFGQDVESVVLGRPAKFSADSGDDQFAQYRLEKAAKIAGFKWIDFCPEPIAAAREFRTQVTEPKTVLIADFGGGTSDYTVLKVSQDAYRSSDVLAIGGVSLAGDSLDGAVMRHRIAPHFGADVRYQAPFGSNILQMPVHLMEKICNPADISLLRERDTLEFFQNVRKWSLQNQDRKKMDQLFSLIHEQLGFSVFEEIERTKRKLSESDSTEFKFDYPGVEVHESIQRSEFNSYIGDRVGQILKSLDDTVKSAQVSYSDIDIICCTGGTAKVPLIQQGLIDRFGKEKVLQHNNFHSIVQGLSERAKEIANGH